MKNFLVSLLLVAISTVVFALNDMEKATKLNRFLKSYNSPLVEHEPEIVKWSNKFNLDYRLYVAISGVESTFGKYCKNYNFTGMGNGYIKYRSVDENIYKTLKTIAEKPCYLKYKKTKKIEDLVYVYKGVPPYKQYIENIKFIMKKIQETKI